MKYIVYWPYPDSEPKPTIKDVEDDLPYVLGSPWEKVFDTFAEARKAVIAWHNEIIVMHQRYVYELPKNAKQL